MLDMQQYTFTYVHTYINMTLSSEMMMSWNMFLTLSLFLWYHNYVDKFIQVTTISLTSCQHVVFTVGNGCAVHDRFCTSVKCEDLLCYALVPVTFQREDFLKPTNCNIYCVSKMVLFFRFFIKHLYTGPSAQVRLLPVSQEDWGSNNALLYKHNTNGWHTPHSRNY